jgi:hypothetical protein
MNTRDETFVNNYTYIASLSNGRKGWKMLHHHYSKIAVQTDTFLDNIITRIPLQIKIITMDEL